MSLEEALAANTAAIKEQTAFLKTLQAGKGGAAAPAAAATTTKPTTKPTTKKLTLETLTKKAGEYLGVEDKKERKLRMANVTALIEHFGAEKVSTIEEENWAEAMAAFEAFEKGEKPEFMDEGEGEGEAGESLV